MIRIGGGMNLAVHRHDDSRPDGGVPTKSLHAQAIFGHGLRLETKVINDPFEEVWQSSAIFHLQNALLGQERLPWA